MVRGFFYFMSEILDKVADTVTNEPVKITVDIKPQGRWDKFLRLLRVNPPMKTFYITQITLGNLIRISKLLTSIDSSIFNPKNNDNILDNVYHAMEKHGNALAVIVAISLYNKKDMPEKSLITFVETNFTAKEILSVVSVVIRQMDVTSFMTTIISVKGINILESQNVSVTNANGKEVSH